VRRKGGWIAGAKGARVAHLFSALLLPFDIARNDLDRVLRRVELQAAHGHLACAEIMARDGIKVDRGAEAATARRLLLDHHIRTLPVVDADRRGPPSSA